MAHSYEDISLWFFETLRILLAEKKLVTVGLAGGSSYDGWYRQMLDPGGKMMKSEWGMIDTDRIRWCVTDERVNCDVSERNDEHIWQVFLKPLCERGLSKEEYFIRPDMDDDGRSYTSKIFLMNKSPQLNSHIFAPLQEGGLDIAFFGLGPDGHTASLFPHHSGLGSDVLGFIDIENAPKFPHNRISLSPKSIQAIHHICLFAVGAQKKEALANFLDDSVSTLDCPAKLLKPEILYIKIDNG